MRQRDLEILLQGLEGFREPKPNLEQYPTPAKVAADILYTAHALGDIEAMNIIDLGCGTGIFTIGAYVLGAKNVTGIDIDASALEIARDNAKKKNCQIDFERLLVEDVEGKFDTCIMNPPFGAQNRHADLPFLDKALELAEVTYSLHNSGTVPFLRKRIEKTGHAIDLEKSYKFEIRHTFEFHRREKEIIDVTLLRIVKS